MEQQEFDVPVSEAAAILKCSRQRVSQMVKEGKLKAAKRGDGRTARLFLNRAEVKGFIEPIPVQTSQNKTG